MWTGYPYYYPAENVYLLFAIYSSLSAGQSPHEMASFKFTHTAWTLYPYWNDVPRDRTNVSKALEYYDICTKVLILCNRYILTIRIKEVQWNLSLRPPEK